MSKPKSTAATGSLGTQLALAGISNAAAAACTNPIDVVKVQLQMDGQGSASVARLGRGVLYDGTFDCFAKVVRTEGWLALFKGFHTQWLRIGPHTTISLMIYEQTRKLAGLGFL